MASTKQLSFHDIERLIRGLSLCTINQTTDELDLIQFLMRRLTSSQCDHCNTPYALREYGGCSLCNFVTDVVSKTIH